MTPGASGPSRRASLCFLVILCGVVALALAVAFLLLPPPTGLTLAPVAFSRLKGWSQDDQSAALASFVTSCQRLSDLDPRAVYGTGPAARLGQSWIDACRAAQTVPVHNETAARQFFERNFIAYRVRDGEATKGLLTGYYEPELRGSLTRKAPYLTPLYLRPPELVTVPLGKFLPELNGRSIAGKVEDGTLVPFATRGQIDDGALADRNLELLWVDNPVDAFFLEIQGSGRVVLDDGRVIRLGYAGKNGRPYTSIGQALIDRGEIAPDDMSLPALRTWLDDHPDEADDLLRENQAYVFFRRLDGPGPLGSQSVALSPGRSLAVDRGVWPLGMPVWLTGHLPEEIAGPGAALDRLVVAQDTGGAITGALRGDLYWGPGDRARALAGHMKDKARFAVLLPGAPIAKGASTEMGP